MLMNWLITFFGNLIGCIIMAVLMVYGHVTHLFEYALASYLFTTGEEKTSLSFGDAFCKGILGNFCLCLAVWLSYGAKDLFSKIAALWTPITLLRALGYEHLISNMFYIPGALFASYEYDLVRDNLDWGRFIYKSLIPVLLGNLIGGAILVGFGYWYIYLTPDNCCSNDTIKPPNNEIVPNWLLAVGVMIAIVALVASIFLFVKAHKLDRAESRRIEAEILKNAAKEDAVDKAIEDGDIKDEPVDEQADYKTDDEQ